MERNTLLVDVVRQFIDEPVSNISPLGQGLINDTYLVESESGKFVLQRINTAIFQDPDLLMYNIVAVTSHIRRKLEQQGETDLERKVLSFLPLLSDATKYYCIAGEEQSTWRLMRYIPDSYTFETVNAHYSYAAGQAFGRFQDMLSDIPETLGDTIPNFHNMEFRLEQFHEAIASDAAGRVGEVRWLIDELEQRADAMCLGERLYREGRLPKRICHCDTKVNNMLFDADGQVLCVIDLDTVMPNFIFSDFGDFMRTGANTGLEDDKDLSRVGFNMEIFRAFTRGYLQTAQFLTQTEKEQLPYAAALFPYMQTVRFLTDYLNGDTYYKIQYPEHNLVRSRAQFRLLQSVEQHQPEMRAFIDQL